MVTSTLGLEDSLVEVVGQSISIRADIQVRCPGANIFRSSVYGQIFYSNVFVEKGHSTVTLANCVVENINGQFWVNHSEGTTVIYRPQQSMDGLSTLIETCAGIGAVGKGFREHGMHTAAYCDNNPKFCSWLRNHTSTMVIEGNIQDMSTIASLSKAVQQPHVINGGVSCQPFSSLGDKGEGQDSRSQSFTGLLKAAFHLQSLIVVMECTPGVKESTWAQGVLQQFTTQTGYHLTQRVLELHHMWPSVRNRWWAVLTHPALGPIDFPQMPNIGWEPSVFHLMPSVMKLDKSSLEQLELDLYELRHFHNQRGGIAKSAFDPYKPMPTATHSWGSQVKGCHCGCRSSGFSEERVANRGLYGVLIPLDRMVESKMGPYHAMRHPHPMEIALINGLEPAFVNTTEGETLRLALAGVGQLASPLQSSWVWGNVLLGIGQKGFPCKSVNPIEVMVDMCKSLFVARDELLDVKNKTKYMGIFEEAIQNLCKPNIALPVANQEDVEITKLIHARCIEVEKSASLSNAIEVPEVEENHKKGKGGKIPKKEPSTEVTKVQTPEESHQVGPQKRMFATNSTGGLLGFETSKKQKSEPYQHGIETAPTNIHEPSKVGEQQPEASSEVQQGEKLAVSATVPWTHPIVDQHETFVETEASLNQAVTGSSCFIACAGEIPASIQISQKTTVGQIVAAENKLGKIDQNATVRTCVGTYVAHDQNVQDEQTYIIYPAEDIWHDEKCPHGKDQVVVPKILGQTRIQGLYQQKGWVALDEMQFYLGRVAKVSNIQISSPIVLPENPSKGIEIVRWILQATEIACASNMSYTTMTAIMHSSHWIPVKLEITEEKPILTTLSDDLSCIRDLVEPINPDMIYKEHASRHVFPADCGFQALAWIMEQNKRENSGDESYPMTATEAGFWRNEFAQHLVEHDMASQIIYTLPMGGMPDSTTKVQLQNLLVQHGVSQDRVSQCASSLIEQLGLHAIQQVMNSPNSWKDLKIRASQHSPPIKIVLAEELQRVIDERINSGKDFGRKQNKENQKPKASVNSWKGIRANQVSIPHTVFKQEDGELLSQITVHQFHQKSKGIAVVNINEAIPFCNLETPISSEGVGMIIVDYHDPRIPSKAEVIQFPAICSDTGDSMLVLGALVQLGQKSVSRNPPANCATIDEIPTTVVRTMVYKDQFNGSKWEQFMQGPVKAIMELSEFKEIPEGSIIDVWDRQHVTKSFQKTKPSDCDLFIVSIRCTQQAAERILEASGQNGVYHEPRTDAGRQPHASFGVVWLPRKTYGEAIVAKQTSPVKTWVVRNGDRYGLRTCATNHKELHRHHKPEVQFLPGETSSFRVGPLPYGTTRSSLQKVCKEWGWTARPVQPQGQVRNGVMWLVQANQVPPFWVYTMSHGDILITQVESGAKGAKKNAVSSAPLASQRTLHHLTTTVTKPSLDKNAPDPFQENDPWARPSAMLSSNQIASIETQVEQRIMAKVQPALHQAIGLADDAEMIPAVDDRVSQLESQIKQINESMKQSTHSFQAFQQQQVQQNQALTHQIASVKNQVDCQHQNLQTMLDSKMEDQMARIEALLTKRAKVNE